MTLRILVVDDEPDLEPLILQRFRKQIRAGDMEFVFARDGREAIEKIESDPEIEVVLSDINMPVMDGLTLLSRLNGMPRLLKTVMVSAYNDMVNLRIAMNRGAYDFVTKPIDFEDLEATVQKTRRELEMLRDARRTREELDTIQSELSVAAKIQQSLLPRSVVAPPGVGVAAVMLPARQVSGDFYDFFAIDGNRFGFLIGDVSGKGIPAALFMAVARTVLRSMALQGTPPGECLAAVNRVLVPQGGEHMYVTLCYAILDLDSGVLRWAVGGHAAPWLIPVEGNPHQLEGPRGFMVGMFSEAVFEEAQTTIHPGDTILIHTDGVTDAENSTHERFGKARLAGVIREINDASAAGMAERITEAVHSFTAEAVQADDITLLAVRYGKQA